MGTEGQAPHTYSVHELAHLAGVSVRTLHHYDAVGLVRPARQANGYRAYGPAEVDRLQQVLLYREVGMGLADIKAVLDDPAFDAACALAGHLARLRDQRKRIDGLIVSVERTLASMKGAEEMTAEEKFAAFARGVVEENERRYGAEARAAYGDEAVDAVNERVLAMSEREWESTQDLEAEIKRQLAAAMDAGGPDGPAAQRVCALHEAWIRRYWGEGAYSREAHRALAQGYVADERFTAYYDAVRPGATRFLADALDVYCA